MPETRYTAHGETASGGTAHVESLAAAIPFDGRATMGDELPGPAHLLASALAACVLKNVERFSHLLPLAYTRASIDVALERQDRPPRIVKAEYRLVVETEDPARRCALLWKNIERFGTISNTLTRACEVSGTLHAKRSTGDLEPISAPEPRPARGSG